MAYTQNKKVFTPIQTGSKSGDMAHKKDEPKPPEQFAWFNVPAGIAAFCAAAAVLGTFAFILIGTQTDRRQSAVVAAVEVSITPINIVTNTPEPTATSEPTRTPYPTKTKPTETQRPMVQVEYIEVVKTVVVEVPAVTVVERVITATAEPTPTQDPVQVLREAQARKAAADIDIQIRKDNARMKRAEFFGSPAFIVTAVVFVVLLFGVRVTIKWNDGKPTLEDTTETAEEIKAEYVAQDAENLRVRLSIRRAWSDGLNMSQAEELTWPDARTRGGAHYLTVRAYYDQWNQQYGGQPLPHPDEE